MPGMANTMTTTTTTGKPPATTAARCWRVAAWAGALLALTAVFAAYLNPHFARDLADWVWSCF
jgi:hypothetical protein